LVERTLVVLKPDAVQRGISGEIITRFEKAGLKIVAIKMVAPDKKHFHTHYEGISKMITRWGEDIFNITLCGMTDSPVIAIVLEGIEAIAHVRKMVGVVDPQDSAPGTIRGDYTHVTRNYTNSRGGTLPNIIHASGNKEEAEQEIELWFNKGEVYEYQLPHESTIFGKIPEVN
jgi:nucleoside-diphosphate kinase